MGNGTVLGAHPEGGILGVHSCLICSRCEEVKPAHPWMPEPITIHCGYRIIGWFDNPSKGCWRFEPDLSLLGDEGLCSMDARPAER